MTGASAPRRLFRKDPVSFPSASAHPAIYGTIGAYTILAFSLPLSRHMEMGRKMVANGNHRQPPTASSTTQGLKNIPPAAADRDGRALGVRPLLAFGYTMALKRHISHGEVVSKWDMLDEVLKGWLRRSRHSSCPGRTLYFPSIDYHSSASVSASSPSPPIPPGRPAVLILHLSSQTQGAYTASRLTLLVSGDSSGESVFVNVPI